VQAGAFVAEGLFDQHETGKVRQVGDLSGGGDADDQVGAGRGELFGDQHGEGRADSHSHDSDVEAAEVGGPHLGVVARPAGMPVPGPGRGQVADDVAVGVQESDRGDRDVR